MNWPAFWVGVGLLGVGLTLWAAFTIAWAATRGARDGEDTSWGLRPAESDSAALKYGYVGRDIKPCTEAATARPQTRE